MFAKKQNLPRVGIAGLGIIGSRVAGHLREAGLPVAVWNRTPKPEPNFLGSPAELAQTSDIIQLFVADPNAVFDVLNAMSDALEPRHTIVCSATIGMDATLKVDTWLRERGVRFLDCPFTGTKGAAAAKKLVYYIGGDDETLEIVRPMLEPVSRAIVKIGAPGQAALVKIMTNVMAAATIQSLVESLAVLKAAGIDPALMGPALEFHGVRSGMIDLKLPKLLDGSFDDTHFSLKHMHKDVQLGVELGKEYQLDLPLTLTTAQTLFKGLSAGWGEQDFSCIMRRYDE